MVEEVPRGFHNGRTAYRASFLCQFRLQRGDLVLERPVSVSLFDGSRSAVKRVEGHCPSCHLWLGDGSRTGPDWQYTIHNSDVSQGWALCFAHQGKCPKGGRRRRRGSRDSSYRGAGPGLITSSRSPTAMLFLLEVLTVCEDEFSP